MWNRWRAGMGFLLLLTLLNFYSLSLRSSSHNCFVLDPATAAAFLAAHANAAATAAAAATDTGVTRSSSLPSPSSLPPLLSVSKGGAQQPPQVQIVGTVKRVLPTPLPSVPVPSPPRAVAVALPGGGQTMWPPPSNASRTALSLTLTRAAIHAHYAQMTDHAYYNVSVNGDLYAPRKLPVQTMSDASIYTLWTDGRVNSTGKAYLLHCVHFDPFCADMTNESLLALYDRRYVPPRYHPSVREAATVYLTQRLAKPLGLALNRSDWEQVKRFQRGVNTLPPAVAVIYDGWVTRAGSVLNTDVFIPTFPESTNLTTFYRDFFLPPPANQTKPLIVQWVPVREVVVIAHVHQNMFWHWVVSELYRIFLLVPYLQANPDVYVHMSLGNKVLELDFLRMLNISTDRMISAQFVKAEVIYYTQFISRDDVPSLGVSQLVGHQIWNALGLPADQRTSVLALPPPPPQAKAPHVWEVNILCIVRTNRYKGRMIANYDELKAALAQLARDYPRKLTQRGVTDQSVDITFDEHLPNGTLPLTMAAYAHADVIIGPHGAGFAYLSAARPGAHAIELITSRHLNPLTSARKGLAYHGVVAPFTTNGTLPTTKDMNFHADVPLLISIVEAALDDRFLPTN